MRRHNTNSLNDTQRERIAQRKIQANKKDGILLF